MRLSSSVATLLAELGTRGALLSGHFKLSSGRHSDRYVEKFRLLEDPKLVEAAAALILERFAADAPSVVVSAAVGGIVLGYECARQLGVKAIFVEKENGVPSLRRGFELSGADRVLVVEDVVTTGLSVREVLDVVGATGAAIAGVGIIVRRSAVDFGVRSEAVLDLPIASYAPEECPQCLRGAPLTERGSRFLRASP